MSGEEADALVSVEQIREMADGAHNIILEALGEAWDAPEHPATDRLPLAFAALRFCALAAQELRDASLFESIADAFSLRVELEDDDYYAIHRKDEDLLCDVTAELLALHPRLGERTIELAADASPVVRRAIAQGLRPEVAGAPALLRKLATDVDPQVRTAARKSLGDTAETPWWTGMLSADPAGVVGEAKAAELRPALDHILKLLNALAVKEIAPLAEALPRELAADVAAHALLHADYQSETSIAPLTKLVLAAPSAIATLDRLVTQWGELDRAFTVRKGVAAEIIALPAKRRADCCRSLAKRALGATETERLATESASTLAANLAGDAWPETLDYGFVLDAVDAIERETTEDNDATVSALFGLFTRAAPRAAHLARIAARFTAPPSEAWREIGWRFEPHLEKLDARTLRPIAERAAASREPNVLKWGLEQLFSKARKKSDPPATALLGAWVADARLRDAVAASKELCVPALPFLREKLRAGELGLSAALDTMFMIAASPDALTTRVAKVAPSALAATAEEWAAFRAVRDRTPIEEPLLWYRLLQVVPGGPRHPADRALFQRSIDATRADRENLFAVEQSLYGLKDEEALIDATSLLAVVHGDDRESVQKLRVTIAEALGVAVPPEVPASVVPDGVDGAPAAGKVAARGIEWMDEPDE